MIKAKTVAMAVVFISASLMLLYLAVDLASKERTASKQAMGEQLRLPENPHHQFGMDVDAHLARPEAIETYAAYYRHRLSELSSHPPPAPAALGNAFVLYRALSASPESLSKIDMVPIIGKRTGSASQGLEVTFLWYNRRRDTSKLHVLMVNRNEVRQVLLIDRQPTYLEGDPVGELIVRFVGGATGTAAEPVEDFFVELRHDSVERDVALTGWMPIAFAIEDSVGKISGFVEIVDLGALRVRE